MPELDSGGPASPSNSVESDGRGGTLHYSFPGKSLREYACIHLRIPETESEWLNELIRKAQRDEFAAKAMGAIVSIGKIDTTQIPRVFDGVMLDEFICRSAYQYADAMLKAREVDNA